MLVLTRRIGERLRIGSDIELVVLDIRGRDVRLGVTAPASVPIHREEIYQKIQEANRAAATGATDLTGRVAQAAKAIRGRAASKRACAPSSAR